jgi:peptidyl-prolyl cis-trans isomerase C
MIVKRRFLLSLLPALVFLHGCGQWASPLPDNVVVRINEEQVTADEFHREFAEQVLDPEQESPEETRGGLKQAYLDQVIERKILVQEAHRTGVKISPEELNQALGEIRKDYSDGELDQRLGSRGMTLENWKVRIEERLLAEKMIRNATRSREKVSEAEALGYYETHRSSFRFPLRVRVRQVLLTDGGEALRLLKELKKGVKFEKAASEKSLGPEKARGGDLGYFSPGERPPEFDRVFSMEVGALSEVVKTSYGYHIFRLDEKIQPREMSFEEAKPGIVQELEKNKAEEGYRTWLKEARERCKVVINKKLL